MLLETIDVDVKFGLVSAEQGRVALALTLDTPDPVGTEIPPVIAVRITSAVTTGPVVTIEQQRTP